MTLLTKTMALRDEAWEAVRASEAFRAFQALDQAVITLGGLSRIADAGHIAPANTNRVVHSSVGHGGSRRIPQAVAALEALKKAGEPLPIGRLMEKAVEEGLEIGGASPINNFRSTLSKDPRFRSVARGNMYFWWFATSPLPSKWLGNETPDLPLENGSGASDHSSQKGGDGHAATMAH